MPKKTDIKSRRRAKPMEKTQKESPLARKARKIFFDPNPSTLIPQDSNFGFLEEPKIVQSYTTYSLGDPPIFDFGLPRQ
jgi:hypothetical protein